MTQTRGVRNNNPFNIRHGSKWQGLSKTQTDKSFCQFDSMNYGIRAGLKLLRNYISGWNGLAHRFNTIEAIISRWAPATENATQAYIRFVADSSGIHRYQVVYPDDKDDIYRIAEAMCKMESNYPLSREQFDTCWALI